MLGCWGGRHVTKDPESPRDTSPLWGLVTWFLPPTPTLTGKREDTRVRGQVLPARLPGPRNKPNRSTCHCSGFLAATKGRKNVYVSEMIFCESVSIGTGYRQ